MLTDQQIQKCNEIKDEIVNLKNQKYLFEHYASLSNMFQAIQEITYMISDPNKQMELQI